MNNLRKKPFTHKMCVRSNHTVSNIFWSIICCCTIIIPFISDLKGVGMFALLLFCGVFFLVGILLFVQTLKNRAKLDAGQYYIYLDMVAGKRVKSDDDSVSYYLQFANNNYEKAVSKKKYDATQIGTQYYLIQLTNSSTAYAAYCANEYYIDKSVQQKFRNF